MKDNTISAEKIASMIDHTNLKPTATKKDIETLCKQADSHNFASVCVNPIWVPLATTLLQNSKTNVCTVIGFPLGALTTEDKVLETKQAIIQGADEIDMVIDIGSLKEGLDNVVFSDIKAVVDAAKYAGNSLNKDIIVKVILETCYLSNNEIERACLCAKDAKADFVKTSTGFAINPKDSNNNPLPTGATEEYVMLMKKTVGDCMKVKASGGIRTLEQALCMINAGASRLGTSSGIEIINSL